MRPPLLDGFARAGVACAFVALTAGLAPAAAPGDDAHITGRVEGSGGFAATFSADGTRILTADREAARVWDARSLKPITPPLVHGARIEDVTWTAGDQRVATIGGKEVRFWDAATGALVVKIAQEQDVGPAAVSADGKWVLTAAGVGRAALWETRGGKQVRLFDDRTSLYWAEFSKNGSEILTFNFDPTKRPGAIVHLRERQSGRELIPPITTNYDGRGPSPAEISPDGRRLVVGTSKGFIVYRIDAFKEIARKATPDEFPLDSGYTQSVHFTPDGRQVIWVLDAGVQLFSAGTGEAAGKMMDVLIINRYDWESTSNGGALLVAGLTRNAGVWDAARATRVESFGEKPSACAALSPDGRLAAIGRTYPPTGERGYTEMWKLDKPLAPPPPSNH